MSSLPRLGHITISKGWFSGWSFDNPGWGWGGGVGWGLDKEVLSHHVLIGFGLLQQPLDVQRLGRGDLVVAGQGGVVPDDLLHLHLSVRRQQEEDN